MNTSEVAAVVAACAAAISAVLTVSLVGATKSTLAVVRLQTAEALKTRVDSRAPRVAIRSVNVDEQPVNVLAATRKITHRVTEPELLVDEANCDRALAIVVTLTVANEGTQTARVAVPDGAWTQVAVGRTLLLAPSDSEVLKFAVVGSLSEWTESATEGAGLTGEILLVVDDLFADGILDEIAVSARVFAVAPAARPGVVSLAPEARSALGLNTEVVVSPLRRSYRMLSSEGRLDVS